MLLGRIEAARANELLGLIQDMTQFAVKHPQLSSMRFGETCRSISLLAYPWRGQLHETYSRHANGQSAIWLPPGFNACTLSNVIEPTTMTTVLFTIPYTPKVRLMFEITDLSDKYHSAELSIDLLEAAAGVRLMPAFPSPPIRTKDS